MNFHYKLLLSLLFIVSLSSGSKSIDISGIFDGSKGIAELLGGHEKLVELFPEIFKRVPSPQAICNGQAAIGGYFCRIIESLLPLFGELPITPLQKEIPDLGDYISINLSMPELGKLFQGPLNVKNVTLYNLDQTTVGLCETGEGEPGNTEQLRVQLDVHVPNLVVEILYDVNITIASLIPIWGQGSITLSLVFDFGLDTTLKYCPLTAPMGMFGFDYTAALLVPPPVLTVQGLLGDAEFVQDIVKMIQLQILNPLPEAFPAIEQSVHANIVNVVTAGGNLLLKEVTPCCIGGLVETLLGQCETGDNAGCPDPSLLAFDY